MKAQTIIVGLLLALISCKKTAEESTAQVASLQSDSLAVKATVVIKDSISTDPYIVFDNNKKNIELQLPTLTRVQANQLYESYYDKNSVIISQIITKEAAILEQFYSEEKTDQKNTLTLGQKLKNHNLKYDEIGEGMVEVTTKTDFYYTLFSKYVTDDYKAYLYLQSEENKSMYAADAGLVISFQELGERIVKWEKFLSHYPKSSLYDKVKESYKYYQQDFIMGLDNTPTTENATTESKYIYPENLQVFYAFAQKYPKSPTVHLITFFKENFKNDDIQQLLKKEQEKL
ncbi:hypothetical protein [Flavobacterium muglaense]|uniref:DUF4163 domain-containing protein n=1 Tax=Flavobacterium muglaense TaxID=2764716 RepID=A0A923MZW1_9FLAO|nr:hypothetical protein [Flavobacterium muglaense]MBC5838099.1 hypothetical protein [Flavobacterium muglaense]MBC5844597.1 hypothetical protein [Flavobacterium muglaense]